MHPQVISASRRTDIPRWCSSWLAAALRKGHAVVQPPFGPARTVPLHPDAVHTLVLWSKDFSPLLQSAHIKKLLRPYPLFCHFTVTGLGGTWLEPHVPKPAQALAQLPKLVDLCGDPRRVVVRFDPVVHWQEEDEVRSNLDQAEAVFQACRRSGVHDVRVSFVTLYPKVRRRSVAWHVPTWAERKAAAQLLRDLAQIYGVELRACADPSWEVWGVPRAACIDGRLLTELHPAKVPAPMSKDRGQRPACLCTQSVDIGSYTLRCPSGCLYCYAHPVWRPHGA